eukprot:7569910-Prorocentrum_lima.AAC.1
MPPGEFHVAVACRHGGRLDWSSSYSQTPRRVNNSPPCSFGPDAPGELASLNLPAGEDIAGY